MNNVRSINIKIEKVPVAIELRALCTLHGWHAIIRLRLDYFDSALMEKMAFFFADYFLQLNVLNCNDSGRVLEW